MKRGVELFLVIGLAVVFSLFIYLRFDDFSRFFLEEDPAYRGLAIFFLCLISTSSVIFPIPYTAAILSLSAKIPGINLLEIALWGGLGSGLGEVSGWLLGSYFRRRIRDSRYSERLVVLSKIANSRKSRWLVPFLVFVFAYTPLPDDVIFIILGAANYGLLGALIPSILGKVLMLYTVAFFGSTIGQATSALPDWASVVISVALFALFLAILELVDWNALFDRYAKTLE